MDKVSELLLYIRKRFYHLDGLIALFIFVGSVCVAGASYVGPHVSVTFSAVGYPLSKLMKHGLILAGLAVAEGIALCTWWRCRALPRFKKDELGIIFAPNFPEELEAEVKRLYEYILHELKSSQLGNRFSIKRLPSNRTICSAEEASAVLKECRGAAAVWGLLDSQTASESPRTGFSSISFTVVHHSARNGGRCIICIVQHESDRVLAERAEG